MATKHIYKIILNKNSSKNHSTYNFGSIKSISLNVGKQSAAISFEISSKKSVEDFLTFKVKAFRDAFRKAYLVHAVKYNEGLVVKKIIISIDGVETVINKTHDPIGSFPYMFSMISSNKLGLDESWANLEEALVKTPKTILENDYRFAAVYSYLESKNRQYAIDKFQNLWTAMNSYYTYIAQCYETEIKSKYGITKLHRDLTLVGTDSASMGAVAYMLGNKYPFIGEEGKSRAIKELWQKNYDVENILSTYSLEEIKDLYDSSFKELSGEMLPEKYTALDTRAKQFEVKLFAFLLIIYPYNWRCKVFHGNRSTTLVMAYNDYEMAVLNTINYFLETFLNKAIPEMFERDFWCEEKQNKMYEYLRIICMKNGKDKFTERLNKGIEGA